MEDHLAGDSRQRGMIAPLQVVVRPRQTLTALARGPRTGSGLAPVLATGLISALLDIAATELEPRSSRVGGLVISLALPVLFLLFWFLGTWMTAAAARAMGAGDRRREHLAVSGQTFPVLIAYSAIALAQAGSLRWAGAAGGPLSDALGLLSLPLLLWFLALSTIAAEAAFQVSTLSATALALLPYAALSAALLLLILVLTVIRI